MRKKEKKWIRFRHRVIRNIAYVVLGVYVRLKYRVKINKFKNKEKRQFFVVMNHQTAVDQFLVGMAIKGPIYYVTSEDLFSNGFVSKLLKWAGAPIPIKKQSTDTRAVLNCMRVAKEGGTIAVFPEGNRTYSGKTEYVKSSIVGLIKALKLPVAIMKLTGGYGAHPRWSDKVRKGRMNVGVTRVLEREEYATLSDDDLYKLLCDELYVNDCLQEGNYTGKALAEYMERALYVCPRCGLSVFHTEKEVISCTKCGISARYLPNKQFEGIGEAFPFRYTYEWYEYQSAFINGLDVTRAVDTPMYTDKVALYQVVLYDKKRCLAEDVTLALFGDRIEVDTGTESFILPFKDCRAFSVLGKNKLNVYHENKVYQIKGDVRFNALKYVQIFYRYKNVEKGEKDGKFLGL